MATIVMPTRIETVMTTIGEADDGEVGGKVGGKVGLIDGAAEGNDDGEADCDG